MESSRSIWVLLTRKAAQMSSGGMGKSEMVFLGVWSKPGRAAEGCQGFGRVGRGEGGMDFVAGGSAGLVCEIVPRGRGIIPGVFGVFGLAEAVGCAGGGMAGLRGGRIEVSLSLGG